MEVDGEQSCSVEVLGAPLPPGAKYMMNRIEDKVRLLLLHGGGREKGGLVAGVHAF